MGELPVYAVWQVKWLSQHNLGNLADQHLQFNPQYLKAEGEYWDARAKELEPELKRVEAGIASSQAEAAKAKTEYDRVCNDETSTRLERNFAFQKWNALQEGLNAFQRGPRDTLTRQIAQFRAQAESSRKYLAKAEARLAALKNVPRLKPELRPTQPKAKLGLKLDTGPGGD